MDIEASAASVQSTTATSCGPSHEHPVTIITSQTSPAPPADTGQVLRRRRVPVKAGTKSVPETKTTTNVFWQHFAHRRKQSGKDYCVLIASGSGANADIVDVSVAGPEDEGLVWKQIRAYWDARRGPLRKYIGLADVETVERVKIRFAKFDKQKDAFIGMVEPLDTAERRENLQRSAERSRACVDIIDGPHCFYTHTWEHDERACPSSIDSAFSCPVEMAQKYQRQLTIMEGLWYLTHCFHDPSMGALQKSLNREPDPPLILRYSDFQSSGNEQPRDRIFHGLLLRDREVGSMFVVSGVMLQGLVSLVTILLTLVTGFSSNDFNLGLSAGNLFVNWISIMHRPRRPEANLAHHNSWYGKEGTQGESKRE